PGLKFPVTLKEAAQVADPKTQTFQVRVGMKKPDGLKALPGMTAVVTAIYRPAGASHHPIRVPISAGASLRPEKAVVWVIAPNQAVSPRPVTMGTAAGGTIEILNGLQPGDRIVVAGAWSLHDGMKVTDLGNALESSPT